MDNNIVETCNFEFMRLAYVEFIHITGKLKKNLDVAVVSKKITAFPQSHSAILLKENALMLQILKCAICFPTKIILIFIFAYGFWKALLRLKFC